MPKWSPKTFYIPNIWSLKKKKKKFQKPFFFRRGDFFSKIRILPFSYAPYRVHKAISKKQKCIIFFFVGWKKKPFNLSKNFRKTDFFFCMIFFYFFEKISIGDFTPYFSPKSVQISKEIPKIQYFELSGAAQGAIRIEKFRNRQKWV